MGMRTLAVYAGWAGGSREGLSGRRWPRDEHPSHPTLEPLQKPFSAA
jgi:hypothetical protein